VPSSSFRSRYKAKSSLTFLIAAGFIRGAMPNRSFVCLLWLLSCLSLAWNAAAQPNLALSLSASPNPVAVGSTLVYTLIVSNASVGTSSLLSDVIVSNTLPSSVTLVSVTGGQGTNVSGNVVVITNSNLNAQQRVTNTITVTPTAAGTISNFALVRGVSLIGAVSATNSILTTVATAAQPNIQAGIAAEPQNVYVDDWVIFNISVTNTGTAAAQNLVISNQFSTNVFLRSVSPSNLVSAFTGTSLVLNGGSLDSMSIGTLTFVVQPTNAGPLLTTTTFSGSNVTNSIQSGSVSNFVSVPNTNQLQVTAGEQMFDLQTGLFRQVVQVSNMSGSNVTSVRVVVMGLGTNELFNAVGTNGLNPFVVFGAPLPDGASTNIVLEYFVWSRTPVEGLTFVAYEANAPAPTGSSSGDAPEIVRTLPLPPDRLLLEFTSEPGATYRILYSDNPTFTNAHLAQPAIVAPADKTQWIDEGPPKTISRLIDTTNRFYRVIKQ
jgi:uncharacterized repeat protein (TIGR01451 family)